MKKRNYLELIILFICMFSLQGNIFAQFVIPTTPNQYVGNSIKALNTGTACIDNNGKLLQAMVVDCDAAAANYTRIMAWDDNNGNKGSIPLQLFLGGPYHIAMAESDPDIALCKVGNEIIAYVVQIGAQYDYMYPRIVIQSARWNGSSFEAFTTANTTFLSDLNNKSVNYPNICINSMGEAIVTWEEIYNQPNFLRRVMGIKLNCVSTAPYFTVSSSTICISDFVYATFSMYGYINNFFTPDVCINDNHVVTFAMQYTHKDDSYRSHSLYAYQVDFNGNLNLGQTFFIWGAGGTINNCNLNIRPRIACIENSNYIYDFAIAYETKNQKCIVKQIWVAAFVYHNQQGYTNNLESDGNYIVDLSDYNYTNFFAPVIAASGNTYDVAYNFLDVNHYINPTTLFQNISRKISYTGSGPIFSDFSIVSNTTNLSSSMPSIAGSNSLNKFCYLFAHNNYAENGNALAYKNSGSSNLILRSQSLVNEKSTNQGQNPYEISIYPNPASDYIMIQNQALLKGNQKTFLEIIDNLGRVIKNININFFLTQISVEDLVKGYYFIKIYSNNKILKVQKILIQ